MDRGAAALEKNGSTTSKRKTVKTESSIRLLNYQLNTEFTKPPRALPLEVRTKIRQVALDNKDSFRDGTW